MKKILILLLIISMVTLSTSTTFASENNNMELIKKTLPEIVSSEWEDIENDSIKVIPNMVSAPILNEVESNNTVGTADTISLNLGRTGKISSSTDVDYYSFTPSTAGKYRFDLVNVPMVNGKDYELAIYDENNTLKGIANSGEEYETIIITLMENSKYFIKVYGYNGAYSTTDSYYITATNDKCALLNYKYPFRGLGSPRKITANYGYYPEGGEHYGLDISAAANTTLYSLGNGTVFSSGWAATGGNYISIKMDNSLVGENTIVTYVHMSEPTTLSRNQIVTDSTIVGKSGNTGTPVGGGVYGFHLHLQINNNGQAFAQSLIGTNNPLRYFTNYKFSGLSEDLTEYNGSRSSFYKEDSSMRMIDETFIDLVGRDAFNDWLIRKEKHNIEWTIIDFFEDFNIRSEIIEALIVNNSNLSIIYDIDEIQSKLSSY